MAFNEQVWEKLMRGSKGRNKQTMRMAELGNDEHRVYKQGIENEVSEQEIIVTSFSWLPTRSHPQIG